MKKLILIVLIICNSSTLVYAQRDVPVAKELLHSMATALQKLNYDSIFYYSQPKQTRIMRIIHKSDNGEIRERLSSLNGLNREVIQHNDIVEYYFPESRRVVVEKNKGGSLLFSYIPNLNQPISDLYSFKLSGQEHVIGRDSWIITIKPNDEYRYGYQLWVDKTSKLLLKLELKNYFGATLEQIIFSKIKILDNIDNALFKPRFPTDDYTWHNHINKSKRDIGTQQSKKWRAAWLPPGFTMSQYVRSESIPKEYFLYTDGLAKVSIFIDEEKKIPSSKSSFGAINAYTTHADDYQITVIGDVPGNTVKQIANAMARLASN